MFKHLETKSSVFKKKQHQQTVVLSFFKNDYTSCASLHEKQ